ncbi:DUF4365 domain-containing protein [Pedobacter sp. G11]|uniref:DUF4365 domain-containing protein n=1 Tax=Pedobacter sp. G11 TaxID=2482728 RepID=UPI000F6032CC|nr:DUF4365 domain-containing protein [Pedobacter sp. G11]AZI26459.1 DUF4365 domain-containing protein [Pedobacter sp. G11]
MQALDNMDHNNRLNLPLPSANPNEDLETISVRKFEFLFDTMLFQLRPENIRDKGVDFFIELKNQNVYTNIRFAVQLKSTKSMEKHSDGSIRYPIDVSNINYLNRLNIPAYYVIYDHREDVFYYQKASSAFQAMVDKYSGGKFPKTYIVSFPTELTPEKISAIYEEVLQSGELYRQVTSHLERAEQASKPSAILIDAEQKVYSIEENITYIERFGFALLNNRDAQHIVEMEQRSCPRGEVSARFNLICGMAYYSRGKVPRALEFLRLAENGTEGFDGQVKAMLSHTILRAKYDLGILIKEDFERETGEVLKGEDIGSFLEMERAWKELGSRADYVPEKFPAFCREIFRLIASENSNPRARAMGYSRILRAEKLILMNELGKNLFSVVGTGNSNAWQQVMNEFVPLERGFHSRLEALSKYIEKLEDVRDHANLTRIVIEWSYDKCFLINFYGNWDFSKCSYSGEISPELTKRFEHHLSYLEKTTKMFTECDDQESAGHNMLLQYNILHFLGDERRTDTADQLTELLKRNDFANLKFIFSMMQKGGTDHERYEKDATLRLRSLLEISKKEGIARYLFTKDGLQLFPGGSNVNWSIKEFVPFDFPNEP